jgi:hypothetical protein
MVAAARGDAGGEARLDGHSTDPAVLGRVAAVLRGQIHGPVPAPVYTLYGGDLDRRLVTSLQMPRDRSWRG